MANTHTQTHLSCIYDFDVIVPILWIKKIDSISTPFVSEIFFMYICKCMCVVIILFSRYGKNEIDERNR